MFFSVLGAIAGNIFSSLDAVFSKKALKISHLSEILYTALGEFGGLIISLVRIAVGSFDCSLLTFQVIGGIVLIVGIVTAYDYVEQYLYRKEKISTLMPYADLHLVFTIILWYIIFHDVSVISLIISIVAFAVVMVFTIDFKKLVFPRSFKQILLVQWLRTLELLVIWWLLLGVPDKEFFIIYQILVFVILLWPILWKKMYSWLRGMSAKFYGYVWASSLVGNLGFLLFLFVVGEFGIVLSILFSFLWTWFTLLCGYLIFKEKPSKKGIVMIVIITILVALGFYFK